jgi:hypothetical protein
MLLFTKHVLLGLSCIEFGTRDHATKTSPRARSEHTASSKKNFATVAVSSGSSLYTQRKREIFLTSSLGFYRWMKYEKSGERSNNNLTSINLLSGSYQGSRTPTSSGQSWNETITLLNTFFYLFRRHVPKYATQYIKTRLQLTETSRPP